MNSNNGQPSVEDLKRAIVQQRLRNRMQQHLAVDNERAIPRADRSKPTPLSLVQRRLWFLDHLDAQGAAYNLPVALHLGGVLDRNALAAALDRLVHRHESLRTYFPAGETGPLQYASDEGCGLTLVESDLSELQVEARRHEVARMLAIEAQTGFDLEHGPLIRGRLLRLSEAEHVLVITQHHIITDGWSLGIMVREFATLYSAFRQGQPDPLPPLPIQYADYAAWQHRWLQGAQLEQQLKFWREHLEGAPGLLELPTRIQRTEMQCNAGRDLQVAFSADLTRKLKALSQQHGCTLFMVLLAGWAVVLARLSGQQDVVIGTPVANRQRPELEGIIGFFVNTLALRTNLAGDPTVAELLAQTRATAVSAFAHQELPFEQVVEALRPQRSLDYSPLFQVMLTLDSVSEGYTLALPGLELSQVAIERTTTHFDLSLALSDSGERLSGTFNYNAELFDASTIERWSQHLQTVLHGMAEDSQRHISALPLLTAQQRSQVVDLFNATAVSFPDEALIHELFQIQARQQPDADAVVYGHQRLTYAELNVRANQVAHFLIGLGVRPDQRVALCVERGLDMAVGILGILKAGAAYVPVDPDYPPNRQAHMLKDCRPVAVLSQQALLPRLPALQVPVLALDGLQAVSMLARHSSLDPQSRASGLTSRNLAYVIYTSGSTGQPKGVMVEHRSAVNFWQVMSRTTHARCEPRSRVALNAAFSFDMSLKGILQLLSGHCLMPIPQSIRANGVELLNFLVEHRIDAVDSTPSQLEGLLSAGLLEGGAYRPRSVLVGGEPIRSSLWGRLKSSPIVEFHNMYGPTEATVDATIVSIAGAAGGPTIGSPIDNARIYILDTARQPVPIGVIGEVHIGGVGVARGYLDKPELTAERFLCDPFSSCAGDRMYRTGDLARWLPDGNIEFLGRNDFQVKIRGFRVELGEIEAKLVTCPGVREAAVVGLNEESGDSRLVAYVVSDHQPNPAQLRDALQGQLPEHMIPSAFVVLASLPQTPNGKLDRQALPAPGVQAVVTRRFEAPRGELEQVLAKIWAELLGLERVGRHDQFFELGGHSLMVVSMVARLRELDLEVPVQAVFTTPTLHALAASISTSGMAGASAVRSPIGPETSRITPAHLSMVSLDQEQIDLVVAGVPGGTGNVQDIYPLLPLQEGLLFHYLLEEEGDTYLSRDLLAFATRERLDAFLQALNEVIARHDILRSALRWEGLPMPVQVVQRQASLPVEVVAVPLAGSALDALEQYADPARLRLDVRNAPLLAAFVAHDQAEGEWLLALLRHHVVCDHMTLELALAEIAALLNGNGAALPVPVPFREIVAQARRTPMEAHQAYFQEQFQNVDEPTAPFGVLDMHVGGRSTTESRQSLEPGVGRRVRESARRAGVSPAVLFHVAWAQVLGRCTGNEDVVFGTVLSGRLQGVAGAERMLGMTINTLPLRVSLGTRSVAQLLEETSQRMQALLAHEHAPLVLAQRCSGMPASTPLFSTLLNYRHGEARPDSAQAVLPGFPADIRSISSDGDHTNFPLSIRIDDSGDAFALVTECMPGIDGKRINGYLCMAMLSLVSALECSPTAPQYQLEILDPQEMEMLSTRFNATARAYPGDGFIHTLFEAQVRRTSEAIAIEFEGGTLTYGELNRRANQLAHHLAGLGVGPDDRIGVCLERGMDMVVALLGVLKAGGAYVPLDPGYPAARLGYMLADSSPRHVLSVSALQPVLAEVQVPVIMLDQVAALDGQPVHDPDPQALGLTPQHLAYVIYTSGSTGRPKGVMNQHDGVVNRLLWAQEEFALGSEDRVLQKTPFGFDVSVWEFFLPLLAGARLVLARPGGHQDPYYLAGVISSSAISVLHFVPSMLQVFLDEADVSGCAGVRQILCSGEALPAPLQNRLLEALPQVALYNLYGPTEAAVDVTCWRCVAGSDTVPIGRPIANTRIHIVDRHLQPVPIGVAGELLIAGVQVARGYLNQPALTAERFIVDPFDAAGGRVYRSGDLARWRADGSIEYLGRNDSQVKLRGLRIELGEIQAQLAQQPGVREAVVVAREDRVGDKRLVAYLVAEAGVTLPTDVLREALSRTLAEYMVPSAFVVLAALPLMANGKLDRHALPAPGLEALTGRAYVAPEGEVEQALAAIWVELLGVERVGRHDHFFELGGHSLTAIQLVTRIRQQFAIEPALSEVFKHPQLAALGDQIVARILAGYSAEDLVALEQEVAAMEGGAP